MALGRRAAALLCAGLLPLASCAEDQVLEPGNKDNDTLPEKMLVFMPGGAVPNEKYVPVMQAVQTAAAASMRLWVVVPTVLFNFCILNCPLPNVCWPLRNIVQRALGKAEKAGWTRGNDTEDTWIAGHSLGGICSQQLLKAYNSLGENPFAGMMLMASQMFDQEGEYDFQEFPMPLMILQGELDGLGTRPLGTLPMWKDYLSYAAANGVAEANQNKPVIILPQVNHSNWCPGFDVPKDIAAEVPQEVATVRIAEATAAFIIVHTPKVPQGLRDGASALLESRLNWTGELLGTYITAETWQQNASDASRSPYCMAGQRHFASLGDVDEALLKNFTVEDLPAALGRQADFDNCRPSVTKIFHSNYNRTEVTSCSLASNTSMQCKFARPATIRWGLDIDPGSVENASCQSVNAFGEQVVKGFALQSTVERYERLGRGLCFAADIEPYVGGRWAPGMRLSEDDKCLTVASNFGSMPSETCSLFALVKLLDWMMTDSLRPEPLVEESPSIWTFVLGGLAVLLCCCCCCGCCWCCCRRKAGRPEEKSMETQLV